MSSAPPPRNAERRRKKRHRRLLVDSDGLRPDRALPDVADPPDLLDDGRVRASGERDPAGGERDATVAGASASTGRSSSGDARASSSRPDARASSSRPDAPPRGRVEVVPSSGSSISSTATQMVGSKRSERPLSLSSSTAASRSPRSSCRVLPESELPQSVTFACKASKRCNRRRAQKPESPDNERSDTATISKISRALHAHGWRWASRGHLKHAEDGRASLAYAESFVNALLRGGDASSIAARSIATVLASGVDEDMRSEYDLRDVGAWEPRNGGNEGNEGSTEGVVGATTVINVIDSPTTARRFSIDLSWWRQAAAEHAACVLEATDARRMAEDGSQDGTGAGSGARRKESACDRDVPTPSGYAVATIAVAAGWIAAFRGHPQSHRCNTPTAREASSAHASPADDVPIGCLDLVKRSWRRAGCAVDEGSYCGLPVPDERTFASMWRVHPDSDVVTRAQQAFVVTSSFLAEALHPTFRLAERTLAEAISDDLSAASSGSGTEEEERSSRLHERRRLAHDALFMVAARTAASMLSASWCLAVVLEPTVIALMTSHGAMSGAGRRLTYVSIPSWDNADRAREARVMCQTLAAHPSREDVRTLARKAVRCLDVAVEHGVHGASGGAPYIPVQRDAIVDVCLLVLGNSKVNNAGGVDDYVHACIDTARAVLRSLRLRFEHGHNHRYRDASCSVQRHKPPGVAHGTEASTVARFAARPHTLRSVEAPPERRAAEFRFAVRASWTTYLTRYVNALLVHDQKASSAELRSLDGEPTWTGRLHAFATVAHGMARSHVYSELPIDLGMAPMQRTGRRVPGEGTPVLRTWAETGSAPVVGGERRESAERV